VQPVGANKMRKKQRGKNMERIRYRTVSGRRNEKVSCEGKNGIQEILMALSMQIKKCLLLNKCFLLNLHKIQLSRA